MVTDLSVISKKEEAIIQRKGEKEYHLTFADVKKSICPNATDAEIVQFLGLCQAEQLDPRRKEIYLVKYGNDPAAMIIAIESYLKVAESRDNYFGHEAGIIIKKKDQAPEFRVGEIIYDDEKDSLAGGWARVYLKDRPQRPVYSSVNLQEYQKFTKEGKLTHFWKSAPAAQIRKVALAHALKEAFPSRFARTVVEGEYETVEDVIPEAFKNGEEENWKLFWAKQKEKGLNYDACLSILNISKVHEEWLDKGKTLEDADILITQYLNKPEVEPEVIADHIPETGNMKAQEDTRTAADIFADWGTAPRIKVNPDEIIGMINDLRHKNVVEVSGPELKKRFLEVYHVQQMALDKCKNFSDTLDILADAHLQDYVNWLGELTKKYNV
jgi:phage recombination protein Bet